MSENNREPVALPQWAFPVTPTPPPSLAERSECLSTLLRGTASRIEIRIAAQAQIDAGIGISYGLACDIHRALSEAEQIIEELRKP